MTQVIDAQRVLHAAIIDPGADRRYLASHARALVDVIRLRLDLKMQPTPARVEVVIDKPRRKALPAMEIEEIGSGE